ncbi:MAG TPA: SpoIIE family protein phosphatase [Mycobacteriales bacterium]|jgi:PAS domain S-box-containing protein|nr:SpoIIE family protein phosphatase [Mycobacteriales bacterium]
MRPAEPQESADASTPAPPAGSPLDDVARLATVRRVAGALGSSDGLDRLTRLAALLLEAPRAQVSLTGEQQVVLSLHGGVLPAGGEVGAVADSLCTVTVQQGGPLVVTDAAADPRVRGLPPVAGGGVRAYLGAPLRDATGTVLGALCVYDDRPRSWSRQQVDVLTELAGSVVAELELRALSEEATGTASQLALILEAAAIGSWELEVDTGVLQWDDRTIDLFGYEPGTFRAHLDSFTLRVHPEDLDRVGAAMAAAISTAGEFSSQYRIVTGAGEVRWVEARGRMVPGRSPDSSPRLLGVAYDTTELREARDRFVRVLETINDGFYLLDRDWLFTYVNRQAEKLLRRSREDLLGTQLWAEFPATLGTAFEEQYRLAMETGEPVVFEAPYDPLGGVYELNVWPGPDGLSVYFKEISQRRQAEAERERAYAEREQAVVEREQAYAAAEAANSRLALLADASTRLAESLEPRQVLERLSELVLPALGRWVAVALTAETAAVLRGQDAPTEPDRVHVVHVAHSDPALRPSLADLAAALPLSTADRVGAGAVVRTGLPEWLPEMPHAAVGDLAADPETRAAVLEAAPASALTVPLISRGRVLGAMTVATPTGGAVDRALLTDLAGRAAVALDNALLYGAERRIGITLQRSLLPHDLPEVAGLQTAARYLPGTTGAFVGGDWYQGVRVGPGLVLAMGDVMGHGMRSAARMGQLRAIVATLALEGHGPAQLLRRLADSVDVLLDVELATLLVAAYDPRTHTLTVASAGHPPPLLAPLAGPPRFVDVEPGPPLGSFPFPYTETVVDLSPGDTLVLYTDGLVENREESLDVGLERLRAALEDVQLPPELVCVRVLERLGRTGGGDDDVALLVVSHLPGEHG